MDASRPLPSHPTRLLVEDIAAPLTLDEADAAIALVTGTLLDIERTRHRADPERVDIADGLWRAKLRELTYLRARLLAGGTDRNQLRLQPSDLRRPRTAEEAAAGLTLIEGRLASLASVREGLHPARLPDHLRAEREWTRAGEAFRYVLACLRSAPGALPPDPEVHRLRAKLAAAVQHHEQAAAANARLRANNGRLARLLERHGVDHGAPDAP